MSIVVKEIMQTILFALLGVVLGLAVLALVVSVAHGGVWVVDSKPKVWVVSDHIPPCGKSNCDCGCKDGDTCRCAVTTRTTKKRKSKSCGCTSGCVCGCNQGTGCDCRSRSYRGASFYGTGRFGGGSLGITPAPVYQSPFQPVYRPSFQPSFRPSFTPAPMMGVGGPPSRGGC